MRWWVLWRKHYIYANSRNTLRSTLRVSPPRFREFALRRSKAVIVTLVWGRSGRHSKAVIVTLVWGRSGRHSKPLGGGRVSLPGVGLIAVRNLLVVGGGFTVHCFRFIYLFFVISTSLAPTFAAYKASFKKITNTCHH